MSISVVCVISANEHWKYNLFADKQLFLDHTRDILVHVWHASAKFMVAIIWQIATQQSFKKGVLCYVPIPMSINICDKTNSIMIE